MPKIIFKTTEENRDYLKNSLSMGYKLKEAVNSFIEVDHVSIKNDTQVVAYVDNATKKMIEIKSKALGITVSEYARLAIDHHRNIANV
jgi:outer membrane protease